jgi:FMN-dependent NADH-azoreductase
MKSLLVINSSGRTTRSITRHLTGRFSRAWQARHPDGIVVTRDVTATPPPFVTEAWIAAAYADPVPAEPPAVLAESNTFIDEIIGADLLVIGAPIYNFGIPAQLKAWVDQIVRVGRTFAIDPASPNPYRPLLQNKPVIIVTSAGDGAMHPGGEMFHLNHLEPHLTTVLGFIGLTDIHFVRAGYDEFQDDRAQRSLAAAEAEIDRLMVELHGPLASPTD